MWSVCNSSLIRLATWFNMNPSQDLQFSTYCLSVGAFHWAQFVRDRLNCPPTGQGPPIGFIPSWTVKNGSSLIAVFRSFFSVASLCGLQSFRTILHCHGSFNGCRSSGEFLLYGLLSMGWAPAWSLLHCGISTACIFLQHISACCGTGSSMGWTVVAYSNGDLNELQGDSLHIHSLHHRLQGICTYSTSSSPNHLTSAGLFQLHFSYSSLTVPAWNLPFLKYASSEVATMLSQELSCVLCWVCWSGWNLLFLSQDSADLLPQKSSLLPPVPNIRTSPPNIIQMVTDAVQNPTISAPLLSCLSPSSPTKFKDLATSLCLLRKWRKISS